MSGEAIKVPEPILQDIYKLALAAFPYECCGWLTGPRNGSDVTNLRSCDNAQQTGDGEHDVAGRNAETAYVIAGEDLKEFANDYDKSDLPPRVIYHSHPNGKAYFSEMDQQAASPFGEPSFHVQHLVVGVLEDRAVEAAMFDWSDSDGKYVEIARWKA